MSLTEVGEAFLESRSHVRPATLDNYRRRLERLTAAIGPTMPVRLIEASDIRSFCFEPHFKNATKRTYLRFCRMLFSWMAREGYVDDSAAAGIEYPKKKDKVSDKIITEGQLKELHEAHRRIQRPKILKGQRRGLHTWFRPLTALGFYTGLRRSEMVRLTWEKIDLENGFIVVTNTKSGSERTVPLQRPLIPYLKAWHRLHAAFSRTRVFESRDGRPSDSA